MVGGGGRVGHIQAILKCLAAPKGWTVDKSEKCDAIGNRNGELRQIWL